MQLIDFKKYENSVKKKKVNKKKIIIITLISILILLVIIMSLIYVYNKQFRDIVDTYIFRKNMQKRFPVRLYGSGYDQRQRRAGICALHSAEY